MKKLSLYISLLLVLVCMFNSCINNKKNAETLNASSIKRINLLVGDSTIFEDLDNEQEKGQLHYSTKGMGIVFVDSGGKVLHKPSQIISFQGEDKNKLLSILNSFQSKDANEDATVCLPMYRHTFLYYSNDDQLIKQVDVCLNCSIINFVMDDKSVWLIQEHKVLYDQFIELLTKKGTYLGLLYRSQVM